MIIGTPEITSGGGRVRLSALIRPEKRRAAPISLWFEFPERYASFLARRNEPFVAAAMAPAMVWGEDIEVRGPLSPKMAAGAAPYQAVYRGWAPDVYKPVAVRGGELLPSPPPPAPAAAASFSGGIDSFFTLLTHGPGTAGPPADQIGYLLFIHGADIALADRRTYLTALAAYERLAAELGLELIPAAINFRETALGDALPWSMSYGGAIIAAALALGGRLTKFYMPSGFGYGYPFGHGSDPRLDHWLSTESLEVVHDGSDFGRVAKTRAVASFPPSYERLRVCWARPDGLRNCGRCEKCVRTMLTLDLLGALPRYSTFPSGLKPDPARWLMKTPGELFMAEEIEDLAREQGRPEVADRIARDIVRCRRIQAWADRAVRLSRLSGHPAGHLRHLVYYLCRRWPLPPAAAASASGPKNA